VPTGLAQFGATSSSISVSWAASTDPDSPVAGYTLYRGGAKVGTSATTSFTDTGLAANASYSYTVTAFDPSGNASAQSAPFGVTATDTTPPSVPAGVIVTGATTTSISLSWTTSTDPDSAVAGYNIYRDGTKIGSSTTASFTDTGLAVGSTHVYTVSAFDAAGNTSAQSIALPASTNDCSIEVEKNKYDDFDGRITYENTASVAETNPTVTFTIPVGATLDPTGCALSDQDAPGLTAVTCSQSGPTITYAFTGSLNPQDRIKLYYSTDMKDEPVATSIFVTAASCQ
jgi:cellulose 1,4-beta-cellobiosidase